VPPEDLAYALNQVVHNFGAVAVVAGSAWALGLARRGEPGRTAAWTVGLAWLAQLGSGSLFGALSLYFYGRTPDLSAVAFAALGIKVACAVAGLGLTALDLLGALGPAGRQWLWWWVLGLGAAALAAAAFLRWFA